MIFLNDFVLLREYEFLRENLSFLSFEYFKNLRTVFLPKMENQKPFYIDKNIFAIQFMLKKIPRRFVVAF